MIKYEFSEKEIKKYGLKIPTDEEIESQINDLERRRKDVVMGLTSGINRSGVSCCNAVTDSCGDRSPGSCLN